MSSFPLLFVVNEIRLPSGDQAGSVSVLGSFVSRAPPVVSGFTT